MGKNKDHSPPHSFLSHKIEFYDSYLVGAGRSAAEIASNDSVTAAGDGFLAKIDQKR
jgi:hypothetical protein